MILRGNERGFNNMKTDWNKVLCDAMWNNDITSEQIAVILAQPHIYINYTDDQHHWTPLMHCVMARNSKDVVKVAQMLIDAGAYTDIQGTDKKTPWDLLGRRLARPIMQSNDRRVCVALAKMFVRREGQREW